MILIKTFIITIILISHPFASLSFQQDNIKSDSLHVNLAKKSLIEAIKKGRKNINKDILKKITDAQKTFLNYNRWELYVDSKIKLANLYKFKNLDKNIKILNEALKISKVNLEKNNPLIIEIFLSLSSSYYKKGFINHSIKLLNEGASYYTFFKDKKKFIKLYNILSGFYYIIFDLAKALEFNEKANLLISNNSNKLSKANYHVTNAKILFAKKEIEKSKSSYNQAIKIYKKHNKTYSKIQCLYELALISKYLEDYEKMNEIFEIIFSILNKNKNTGGRYRKYIYLYIYENIGIAFTKQKNFNLAHKYFLKALNSTSNKQFSSTNLLLGNSHKNFERYDSALYCYQQGLMSIINANFNFKENDYYKNPTLDYIHHIRKKKILFDLLKEKADAFYIKYDKYKNNKDLETAFQTNIILVRTFDKILEGDKNALSTGSQLNWSQFMLPIYEQAIKTSLAMFKNTGEEKYQLKAFEIAEKSKATTLLSGIKSSNAKQFSGIPDSLLTKEKDNRIDYNYYEGQLQKLLAKKDGYDTTKVNELREKTFALNREQDKLTSIFEKQYPKYHQLKYNQILPNINSIQKKLGEQTTLIEYFVGDSTNYVFTISKNGYAVKELVYIDSLGHKVKNLPQLLKQKDKEGFSELSYELYQQLITPLNIKTKNLIIIPGGELWQLNFDLLLTQKPKKLDYRKFDYLIKDHSISYAYSAKLLFNEIKKQPSEPKNDLLAFSYNDAEDKKVGNYIAMRGFRDNKLGDLPGTRKEIKAISGVMEGSYYYGTFASEKNFKENAKDYKILHLALHGVIDNKNPMNSKLYFTQDNDSIEDNYLHAYELYNIELNADLAVLSACNTGQGKLIKGEGVMSLGRAFTYAGCKSLLLSQWEVSDAFTPAIMKDFYQNIKDGKTKADALRDAKLAYLSKADNLTSNPYYWAPLVQLGDNSPIEQDSYWKWILGVNSLLIMIGLVFYLRKMKSKKIA